MTNPVRGTATYIFRYCDIPYGCYASHSLGREVYTNLCYTVQLNAEIGANIPPHEQLASPKCIDCTWSLLQESNRRKKR